MPMRQEQFEKLLADIPFMEDMELHRFVQCIKQKAEEVAHALSHKPSHGNLKNIRTQLDKLFDYTKKMNNNGRELYTRNRWHKENRKTFFENVSSGNLNRIANETRSQRNYYKRLRKDVVKTRRKRISASAASNSSNSAAANAVKNDSRALE